MEQSKPTVKRGRLSADEVTYIRVHEHDMSVEQIATKLSRTADAVKSVMAKPPADIISPPPKKPKPALTTLTPSLVPANVEPDEALEVKDDIFLIKEELRRSEAWKHLKDEFSKDELKFFEESFVNFVRQVKDNILYSETIQIFQSVKMDILMHRNLKARKKSLDIVERLEEQMVELKAQFTKPPSSEQLNRAYQIEALLAEEKSKDKEYTVEYTKLHEKHASLMQSLKVAREQRVEAIENSKVSYLGIIKMLQQNDYREKEARTMSLMKLAGEREYQRLSRPLKYEDGQEDLPILSADSLALYDAEHPEEAAQP